MLGPKESIPAVPVLAVSAEHREPGSLQDRDEVARGTCPAVPVLWIDRGPQSPGAFHQLYIHTLAL